MTIRTTELAELQIDRGEKSNNGSKGWYINTQWGILVWIELLLKTSAILTALITLTTVTADMKLSVLRVVEECLVAPLVIGLFAPMIVACTEKEVFSFSFTLCTILAHLAVIGVLLFGEPGFSVILFCGFMIVGEIYRLTFLDTTERTPGDSTARRRFLIGFIFFYIIIYLAILVLETANLIDVNSVQ